MTTQLTLRQRMLQLKMSKHKLKNPRKNLLRKLKKLLRKLKFSKKNKRIHQLRPLTLRFQLKMQMLKILRRLRGP
jgi:hypothetical protein